MPPLISVIIPVYNGERYIGQAVRSVLAQTWLPHEIIVIDDGSTDKTRETLEPFWGQIQYLFQPNQGPSAARNAGIKVAQGDLICFLDADDLWTPEKLEVQLMFMQANPETAMVFADHEEFNREGLVLASYLREKRKAFLAFPVEPGTVDGAFGKLVIENFISTPTVMLRKCCLERAGVFDEKIRSVEDRDLWMRISASFPIACIPRILCKRRMHGENISRKRELTLQGRIRILENNWNRFPLLLSDQVWRAQLVESYCHLGFLLLQQGRKRDALRVGVKSLYSNLKGRRGWGALAEPSSIVKSVGLVGAALLGWNVSRVLWRPLKNAFR
ncbi:MAG: glycosyltransferase family 2 protein [Nitrospira sp.]|nr:glycosyltransferase family 2 protein [Nitrospira sp.]MCB9776896.1 glycosyltransferase family 2 protein [Nitrospiraceae bacterium]